MTASITYSVAREIAGHAESQAPREACGLLAGDANNIVRSFPVSNAAGSPEKQYQLDAIEQLKALKAIDSSGQKLIGVYHSHPQSPPILSDSDIAQALDPKLLHLIVSLSGDKPKLKLWRVDAHQVTPIDLIFDTEIREVDGESFGMPQKVAMLVVGIASLLIMLAISVSLLPPAPEITTIP